jgi:hypothetical protein
MTQRIEVPLKLLFVANLGPSLSNFHQMKWRPRMKLLFISHLARYARAVSTITKYVQVGRALGHEVAVFGERRSEPPVTDFSLDVKSFDYAIFIIYHTEDFPDLPYLAHLLDGMPKERRVVIDCTGRYNDTIRIEHDFNHLEKLDGHQGWEWEEGIEAISDKILQPTLRPLRSNVRPFLFHAFDAEAVTRTYPSPVDSARAWSDSKPFGMVYVGNNWQRWTQMRTFLEAVKPVREELGPICLAGWHWDERPEWAIQMGLQAVDVDPDLLSRVGVEVQGAVSYEEVIEFVSQGRFCPVFHRPLFNHLGLVTNRTFETFCSDTIPLLMVPDEMVDAVYGEAARPLAPGRDVTGSLRSMIREPQKYWDAVLKTRSHLAEHHSYQQRFKELITILED